MSPIIVRGLDEHVKQQLSAQAKEHGRSMEAEVRDILTKAARRPHIGMALLSVAREAGGVDELPIPTRDDVASASNSWTVECGRVKRHSIEVLVHQELPEADLRGLRQLFESDYLKGFGESDPQQHYGYASHDVHIMARIEGRVVGHVGWAPARVTGAPRGCKLSKQASMRPSVTGGRGSSAPK